MQTTLSRNRALSRLALAALVLLVAGAARGAPAGGCSGDGFGDGSGDCAGNRVEAALHTRIVVTGRAEVVTEPDQASFSASVTNNGRDADAVLDANARRSERMLAALRGTGIEITRLQTQGVRLQPEWSPRPRNASADWRPEIVGYRASNRLEVVTQDLSRVGALLAAAAEAGANGIDGIRFTLEDDTEARDEAIRRATDRALAQARIMAEAAGVTPGAVLELRLDHANTNLPRPLMQPRMEMAMMDASSARAMPVEAGEIRVDASVTLTLGGH